MSVDVSKLKPGQNLQCVIEKLPRTADQTSTIARLMRMDPTNKRALKRAQRMRKQRMVVYNRGNRDWVSREHPAKVVHVGIGEKWTLPYSLDLAHDLVAIQGFVGVKVG
ncbi:MAG: hypothetical protein JSR77_07520 [Planctomycetes bacterium]|nr:hypothetical protein [Planctomycetota bacterium]